MNKKQIVWTFIIGAAFFWLAGCGQKPITVSDLSNCGEVSGKVYDALASNPYTPKYVPVAGAKIYVGTFEAASAADGSFQFSGLPAGAIVITASKEGYTPQTLAVNRKTVNIYLTGLIPSAAGGGATVTGSVYGLPAGITSVHGWAASLNKVSAAFSYDPSLYKYTLANAPDDGETYLFAFFTSSEAGVSRLIYTYAKTSLDQASQEVNLDFSGSTNFIYYTYSDIPQGYNDITYTIDLVNGCRVVAYNIYSKKLPANSPYFRCLPNLQAGDAYRVGVTAVNTAEGKTKSYYKYGYKYNYDYNSGALDDLEFSFSRLPGFSLTGPAESASLSDRPTFSWEAISDERAVYQLSITDGNSNPVWAAYTSGNSISLPKSITLSNGNYRWQVAAAKVSNLDIADLVATLAASYVDWGIISETRRFNYAK